MALIERHCDQIALSSESIATLPFPPPKIFTNALLASHDITALIRDTEAHERALFSVQPPAPTHTATTPYPDPNPTKRRQTVFNVAAGEVTTAPGPSVRAPRRNTAVAAVLGPELNSEVKRAEGKGEVDIEVLLQGAEKLNNVYSIQGVPEKIHALRTRHGQLNTSLAHYEAKVTKQTRDLEKLNRGDSGWQDEDDEEFDELGMRTPGTELEEDDVTEEDLRREEEDIRDLEAKKRELEERVRGMERDLGGLLR